jgi:putative ABC transport system permease protein
MTFLDHLLSGARALAHAKAFTVAAVATLAIGIAGATVMFALVDGVLLEPLPVRSQEALVVAWRQLPGDTARGPFGAASVRAVREHTQLLESVAAVAYNGAMEFVAVENGVGGHIRAGAVSGDFFRVLGTDAIAGRTLRREDDFEGAEYVVVIGEGLWRRRYAATPDVIGRRLELREQSFVIVGVVPDVDLPRGAEAWMTLETFTATTKTAAFRVAGTRDHDLIARMRPGVTIEQARTELQTIAAEAERIDPEVFPRGTEAVVQSYEAYVVGDVRSPVWMLFGAVALVLLIASANVANLLLLRGEARRSEMAVRAALGASRRRLIIPLIAEAVVLGALAAVVAVTVSWWSLEFLVALSPAELPRLGNVQIDARVVLFATVLGVISAAGASVGAALLASRVEIVAELRATGTRTTSRSSRLGRRTLVVAQVATSVVIIAAAGVLTRTLLQLQSIDIGMASDRLVFVELFVPEDKYPVDTRRAFFDRLLPQLRSVPGIEAVSPVGVEPYAGLSGWTVPRFVAEGQGVDGAAANPSLNLEAIHPEHFETLGVRLLRGRGIAATDRKDAPPVTVVSADVARRVWPNEDAIGQRIKMGSVDARGPWLTVVGVAEDTRYRELAHPQATMYVAAAQFIDAASSVAIRTSTSLDMIAGVVRARVRDIDPAVHVLRVDPFATYMARPLARPRFVAWLSNLFGGLALLLAGVGLYGVLAAFVRQSTREIGVRVALGATRRDVRRVVLGEAVWLAGVGVSLGLIGAAATNSVLRGLLFGVQPLDPVTLAVALAVLACTCAAACYVPLRRAVRVDPVALLRGD